MSPEPPPRAHRPLRREDGRDAGNQHERADEDETDEPRDPHRARLARCREAAAAGQLAEQPGEPQRDRDATGESQRRRPAGRRRIRGSNMRARFWSTEPGSTVAHEPALVAGWRAALARQGCSVGTAVRVPRRSSPASPTSRSPATSRRPVAIRIPRRPGRPVGCSLRRVGGCGPGAASDSGSLARSGSVSGSDRAGSSAARSAPVPGTPVRACAGLRTRAGSASSRCPMSCRTSCCRPSRGRTAGRRPRRSWSSRGSPCAGRVCPLPVGRARRMTAGGCPTARSSRRRPVASAFVGARPVCPPGRVCARRVRLPRRPRTGGTRLSSGPPGPPPTSCS